jgi:hypothetical protein
MTTDPPRPPERPAAWNEATWARTTEQEILIDLAEWADAAGRARPTSYCCGVTNALWTLLETGLPEDPARLESRIRPLVRAIERILQQIPAESLSAPGAVADFSAPMPSRTGAPAGRPLRLHAERGGEGALFVSIGLPTDFDLHPLERPAKEPSRGHKLIRVKRGLPPEQTRSFAALLLGVLAGIAQRALGS